VKIQSVLGPLFPEIQRPLNAEDSPLTLWPWDSVRQVDVILAVEDAFAVELTTAEIADLKSVGSVVDILRRRGMDVEV